MKRKLLLLLVAALSALFIQNCLVFADELPAPEDFEIDFSAFAGQSEAEKNSFIDNNFLDPGFYLTIEDEDSTAYLKQKSKGGETIVKFGKTDKWADFTLNIRIKADYGHLDWTFAKILLRSADETSQNNSYKFNFKNNQIWLSKQVDGQEIMLDGSSFEFTQNTWFDVTCILNGNYIAVLIDGEKLLEATDGTFSSGYMGICTWQTGYSVSSVSATQTVDNDLLEKEKTLIGDTSFDFATMNLDNWYLMSDGEEIYIHTQGSEKLLKNTNSSDYTRAMLGTADQKNTFFSLSIRITERSEWWNVKLLVRANGWENNAYYVMLDGTGLSLIRNANGAETTLGSYDYAFELDTFYDIGVSADGNEFKVYLDGTRIINAKDEDYGTHISGFDQMGRNGIMTWQAAYDVKNIVNEAYNGQMSDAPDITQPSPSPATSPTPSPSGKGGSKALLWIIISAVAVVGAGAAAYFIILKNKKA